MSLQRYRAREEIIRKGEAKEEREERTASVAEPLAEWNCPEVLLCKNQ